MMKRASNWVLIMTIVLLVGLAGCGSKEAAPTQAVVNTPVGGVNEPVKAEVGQSPQPPATQAPATHQVITKPVGGTGTFDLKKPGIGLDSLASYSQHFIQSFDGQKDGTAFTSSMEITNTVQREQAWQLSSLRSVEKGSDPVDAWMLTLDGAGYFRDGEGSCQGFDLASLQDPGAIPDPASLLPLVFGAEAGGEETVNGVIAFRYTFDQRALAQYQAAKASGSVWVAKEGGWVVKYILELTAPKGVLGAGLEGKQTWAYDISGVGAVQGLSLPQGCTVVLIDFPVSPGAQNVQRMSGSLVYSTTETVEALSAFFKETMTGSGWKAKEMFPANASGATLNFVLPEGDKEKVAAIQLNPNGSQVDVTVVVFEEVIPTPTP